MHPLIYDVAVSIDGFIAGPSGDVSRFTYEGPVVDDYRARLSAYATAIMGRKTYEAGYAFGMTPGQNPYASMKTIVFSTTIALPDERDVEVVAETSREVLSELKASSDGPVYLCGGGEFAGALLRMGLIDRIRLKRAPIYLGGGIRLFGPGVQGVSLRHLGTRAYDNGYLFQEFESLA